MLQTSKNRSQHKRHCAVTLGIGIVPMK